MNEKHGGKQCPPSFEHLCNQIRSAERSKEAACHVLRPAVILHAQASLQPARISLETEGR